MGEDDVAESLADERDVGELDTDNDDERELLVSDDEHDAKSTAVIDVFARNLFLLAARDGLCLLREERRLVGLALLVPSASSLSSLRAESVVFSATLALPPLAPTVELADPLMVCAPRSTIS